MHGHDFLAASFLSKSSKPSLWLIIILLSHRLDDFYTYRYKHIGTPAVTASYTGRELNINHNKQNLSQMGRRDGLVRIRNNSQLAGHVTAAAHTFGANPLLSKQHLITHYQSQIQLPPPSIQHLQPTFQLLVFVTKQWPTKLLLLRQTCRTTFHK